MFNYFIRLEPKEVWVHVFFGTLVSKGLCICEKFSTYVT